MEVVSHRNLFLSDVEELGSRLQRCVDAPHSQTFPPDEVLHLLHSVSLVARDIQDVDGSRQCEEAFGAVPADGNFSWRAGIRLLRRPETILRTLRLAAAATREQPPRLIQLSRRCLLLLEALGGSARWRVETFERIGQGAKCCEQFFEWTRRILQVYRAQTPFIDFIAESYPRWLPQLLTLQSESRRHEFDIIATERCLLKVGHLVEFNEHDMPLVERLRL
jgi:hypothetical protein